MALLLTGSKAVAIVVTVSDYATTLTVLKINNPLKTNRTVKITKLLALSFVVTNS